MYLSPWAYVITILIITMLRRFLVSKVEQGNSNYFDKNMSNLTFKVSKWSYIGLLMSGIMLTSLFGGTAFYVFYLYKTITAASTILFIIGVLFLVATVYEIYRYSKTYVLIKNGFLIYYNGWKIKINCELKDIKSVYVSPSMNIVIDVGKEKKYLIPIYIGNSAQLVKVLKSNINYGSRF